MPGGKRARLILASHCTSRAKGPFSLVFLRFPSKKKIEKNKFLRASKLGSLRCSDDWQSTLIGGRYWLSNCHRPSQTPAGLWYGNPKGGMEIRRVGCLWMGFCSLCCRQRIEADSIQSYSCPGKQLGIQLPVSRILLILLTSMGCASAVLFLSLSLQIHCANSPLF